MNAAIEEVRPIGCAHLARAESVACILRLATGVLLVAMTIAFEPRPEWLAVTAAVTALGWSMLMALALRAGLHPGHTATLARGSYWFDLVLPLIVYAVFLVDPEAIAVAALPLLVFRLAVRFGTPGAVVGAALFATLVTLRVVLKVSMGNQELIRPSLILAWALVLTLVLLLGLQSRHPSVGSVTGDLRSGRLSGTAATATVAHPEALIGTPASGHVHSLAQSLCVGLGAPVANPPLTRREQEVLLLLGLGHSYNAIASRLFISASTVRNHVHNLRGKLEMESREEMMALAREVAVRVQEAEQSVHAP